jgi:hypothetical protein
MFPVTVQFIVAMLAYALNERMARRLDYLQEENRVLKEALKATTGKTRVPLTDEQRLRGRFQVAPTLSSSAPRSARWMELAVFEGRHDKAAS